jgi:hypothetical protein
MTRCDPTGMYRVVMTNGDVQLDEDQVPGIRQQFVTHGYSGHVFVVDDQADEAVFLIAVDALASLRDGSLCIALQGMLGRKVWVIEESEVWRRKARQLW